MSETRIGRLILGFYGRDWFTVYITPLIVYRDRVPHKCGFVLCLGPFRFGWRWLTPERL